MIGTVITSESVVSVCLKFIEDHFPIKFTRKSYDNEKLKVYYKVSWFNGQPICVALVMMRKNYWHITHIATKENFRAEGHAKKLVKKITRQAKKAKVEYISCNIRNNNLTSIIFFRNQGFVESENPSKTEKKENFLFFKKDLK